MNKFYESLVGLTLVALLVVGVNFSISSAQKNSFTGGGITNFDELELSEGLVVGGEITEISSAASSSLTAAQVCDSSVIRYTPTGASLNVTLPATTTLIADCLSNDGDSVELLFENAATAATTTTLVAGGGIDLQEPDGQNVVIGQNNYAYLTFHRISSTNIIVRVDETIPAD